MMKIVVMTPFFRKKVLELYVPNYYLDFSRVFGAVRFESNLGFD